MIPDVQSIDLVDGTTIYEGESGAGNTEASRKWKIRRITVVDGKTSRMFPIGQNTNGGPSKDYEFSFADAKVLTYAMGVDAAAPTLSTVTIASNNSTTTLAKVGDTVTLTIIASEVLENISATIAGHTATIVPGVDGAHYTATYVAFSGTMVASEAITAITGIVSCSFTLADGVTPAVGTATAVANGTTTVSISGTAPNLPDTDVKIKLVIKDAAGNEGTLFSAAYTLFGA